MFPLLPFGAGLHPAGEERRRPEPAGCWYNGVRFEISIADQSGKVFPRAFTFLEKSLLAQ
jgi:hypothetical protein